MSKRCPNGHVIRNLKTRTELETMMKPFLQSGSLFTFGVHLLNVKLFRYQSGLRISMIQVV